MTQRIHRLSAVKIANVKQRGLYADGGGLYLQVSRNGSRSWIYRFKQNGRARDMGVGFFDDRQPGHSAGDGS
jgi:hypothetical protein